MLHDIRMVLGPAKTIDSPTLNRLGVQPMRACLARGLYNLRPAERGQIPGELATSGIAVIEDFLAPEAFTALVRAADVYTEAHEPDVNELHGTTAVVQHYLGPGAVADSPELEQCRTGSSVPGLLQTAERQPLGPRAVAVAIEHVQRGNGSVPDPMANLHVDTFHHTFKAWLYFHDVDVDDGPFVYVPGSHILDRVRLRYDYLDSIGGNTSSRPVSDGEVEARGLVRRAMTASANSLVIVDTCGYHARSAGLDGRIRRTLLYYTRTNPFRLFPTRGRCQSNARAGS